MVRTARTLAHGVALAAALALISAASAQAQGMLSAQDMAEIQNLYAQYNIMLDSGDAEGWADTFVENGRFGNSEGRAALIEFAEGFHESNPQSRHWNTNLRLTQTADGAAGTTYLMLYNVGVRPPAVIATGIYQDVLVRTAQGWRFQSRQVQIDRPAN
ncbi:MAG TPA: nuclear transport factor 2 family protein [Longimicrobiaceae bacterium]|nr:nuclear transport factor 2 family protein [Longimicrobiaceae bacterium]